MIIGKTVDCMPRKLLKLYNIWQIYLIISIMLLQYVIVGISNKKILIIY